MNPKINLPRKSFLYFTLLILLYSCSENKLELTQKPEWEVSIDSSLLASIKLNKVAEVDSIVKSGISLDGTDRDGATALMWACYQADSNIVKTLVEAGAKPSPKGGGIYYHKKSLTRGFTPGWYGDPISAAAGERNISALEYLLRNTNYDINKQVDHPLYDSLSAWTPLMHATYRNEIESIKYLIEANVDLSLKNKSGNDYKAFLVDSNLMNIISTKASSKLKVYLTIQQTIREANQLVDSKKYTQSRDTLSSLMKLIPDSLGVHSHYLPEVHQNIADSYFKEGLYDKAKESYEKAIELTSEYALLRSTYENNLAITYNKKGDFETAIEYYKKSIYTCKQIYGKDNLEYAIRIGNLASTFDKAGKYDKALPLTIESTMLFKSLLGEEDKNYGLKLNNLASIYGSVGEYDKAIPFQEKAIQSALKHQGRYNRSFLIRNLNLAELYRRNLEFQKSLNHLLICDNVVDSILPPSHPMLAMLENKKGLAYNHLKDYKASLQFYQNALSKKINPDHKNIIKYNLADIYLNLGQAQEAYKILDEIIKNDSKANNNTSRKIRYLVRYSKSLIALDRPEEASQNYLDCAALISDYCTETLPYMEMNLQLKEADLMKRKADQIFSFFMDKKTPYEIYNLHQTFKNLTIKNAEFIDNKSPEFKKWHNLKQQIGKEQTKTKKKQNKLLESWIQEVELLQSKIIAVDGVFNTDLEKENSFDNKAYQVIDINHFKYYNTNKTDSTFYVAYLFKSTQPKEIIQTTLFEEKELTQLISQKKEISAELFASKLYDLIWSPLEKHLDKELDIMYNSSGVLTQINHSTALNGDQYFLDKYKIHTCSYNFLTKNKPTNNAKKYLLVGGVNYDFNKNQQKEAQDKNEKLAIQKQISNEALALRTEVNDYWSELPYTKKEVESISEKLNNIDDWSGILLKDGLASEEKIKQELNSEVSPNIVHFATHGFFYPNLSHDKLENTNFKSSENPMVRSGLILANANYTWQGGTIDDNNEDGILTALEIQNLNLKDTELVVLSACDTGLGEINGSEGVFGLQRAFKIAGAKKILMTLNKIPDQVAYEFMEQFYENWLTKKQSLHTAFYETQKRIKSKYPDPNIWGAYILLE